MPLWLQALIAVGAFWTAAFFVGRRTGLTRLLYAWIAAFALLTLALLLDALGLKAAGWAAFLLIIWLFVLGAAFAFLRWDEYFR